MGALTCSTCEEKSYADCQSNKVDVVCPLGPDEAPYKNWVCALEEGQAHGNRVNLVILDASNTRLLTLTGITTTTPTPSHNASLKTSVRSQNADNCALLTTASTLGLPLAPVVQPLWPRPLGWLHQPPHQD